MIYNGIKIKCNLPQWAKQKDKEKNLNIHQHSWENTVWVHEVRTAERNKSRVTNVTDVTYVEQVHFKLGVKEWW